MKIKAVLFSSIFIFMASAFNWQSEPEINIYLIGDSTMADKPGNPEENPERGWGQLLPIYFNKKVAIYNHAVNGRSSESFIGEGRWETVLKELKSGDYVFIQFGHNDQKIKDPKRFTNPYTGYRRNLEKYVNETRAKGAYPILLSSIVRRKFNEHGTLKDTNGAYPFMARTVAENMNVPFIDMQLMTEDYVKKLGPEKSKEIYLWVNKGEYEKFPDGKEDDTHLNIKGATEYAGMVAKKIKEMNLPLAKYLSN